MNTDALIAKLFGELRRYARYLLSEWNIESTILVAVILTLMVFLLREKPITNLLLWLKSVIVMASKFIVYQLKRPFKPKTSKPIYTLPPLLSDMRRLKVANKDKYNIPYYLALNVDSNFQSLMDGANTADPEKLMLRDSEVSGNKSWFIFNEGCVIEGREIEKICDELIEYRPERPIDGVIICCSEQSLREGDLTKISERLFKQLWEIQTRTQFVVPVYIIVSECESIQGFTEFWKQPPMQSQHAEILGWSNPYEKHREFEPNWITTALTSITRTIKKIHISGASWQNTITDTPNILLFPRRLLSLAEPISELCSVLFSKSKFHDSFMFRGVYFSGSLSGSGVDSEEATKKYLETQKSDTNDEQRRKAIFLSTLFSQKIFAEKNLAYAPRQQLFSSNKSLRRLQYLSASILFGLSLWLSLNSVELYTHANNLVTKIDTLPEKQQDDNTHIIFVEQVLEHVAEMNASNLKYPSIPASWVTKYDEKLTDYFAGPIFGDIIFPSFQCRSNLLLEQQLEGFPDGDDYEGWLQELLTIYGHQSQLHNLMSKDTYPHGRVKGIFGDLVDGLFEKKLPKSFYSRSDFYFEAIRTRQYPVSVKNMCDPTYFDQDETWQQVRVIARRHLSLIASKVEAPHLFFENLNAMQTLPVKNNWYQQSENFSPQLEAFIEWGHYLTDQWFAHGDINNSCQRMGKLVGDLEEKIFSTKTNFRENYEKECFETAKRQFLADNNAITPSLYRFNNHKTHFSPSATALFEAIKPISELSFARLTAPTPFNENELEFFWSVDQLKHAIRMFDEYANFAAEHYQRLSLVELSDDHSQLYLAQAVTLKQLQFAMLSAVSNARTLTPPEYMPDEYDSIDQEEAQLNGYVTNFTEAQASLLKVIEIFERLNFNESSYWLKKVANQHAYHLLKKVDNVYRDGRIYQPFSKPLWGAQHYGRAMFGLASEGQMEDYLSAQSTRLQYITDSYAKPLIQFLKKTDASTRRYQLFSQWDNTLLEISKKNDNDNDANSRTELESFFRTQLFTTNQSDCRKQTKGYVSPPHNNLFAIGQRNMIEQAVELCKAYSADQIKNEYRGLRQEFTRLLAGQYPFAQSSLAPDVKPIQIRKFLEFYAGKSAGLAHRMEILIWTQKEDSKEKIKYRQALEFVKSLDAALAFFSGILLTDDINQASVEVALQFDVLAHEAAQVEHINQWQFIVGTNSAIRHPSDNGSIQPQRIRWYPNNSVTMTLDWASDSPYAADHKNINGNQLLFRQSGTWGLLRFIQAYKNPSIEDTENFDKSTMVLDFNAPLSIKRSEDGNQSTSVRSLKALARLSLFAPDPKDKGLVAIILPANFPDHAPEIGP